jgi:diguanylate cyclase (GGDEF)-like protein/PAS domain S-box-containing protein
MTDKIIVVEDEGITAMHLREMLVGWGYEVPATADRAEDALDRIAAQKPDLVLMDIHLKGRVDGVAAAEVIQRRFDIPVVFLSAHSDKGTLRRVKSSRAYGFVVKPFDERDVQVAVKSALYQHRIDRALRSTREWRRGPLSSVAHAVISTDAGGRIIFINKGAEALTGWTEIDAFERDATMVLRLVGEGGNPPAEHPITRVLRTAEIALSDPDSVVVSRDGSEVPIGYRVVPIQGDTEDIIGLVISLRHRRDRRHLGDPSTRQPERDPLTGLADRTLLMDCLGDAIARAQHDNSLVAVLILDLDRFKDINESPGRAVGDLLLGAIAARVQNCVRGSDSVARIGDDEFAVVQLDLETTGGAVFLAEKLLDIFSDPFVVEGQEIKVTTSVGVAVYPVDGDQPEDLVSRADEALNRAKAAGRNQYKFHGDMAEGLIDSERSLEQDLGAAMERDQLEVWYQPIFSLSRHEITGAEALLRWRHPERGVIPASRFIPVADRSGLLAQITDWVLREALERAGEWQAGLPGIRVSVNIAGSELRRRDLVPTFIHMLDSSSLEARHLEIEIREDLLIRQLPMNSMLNLQRLRQLGVCLTLDNFGFAYASMMSLKKLPLSRIKIDRSLVAAISHDAQVEAIVKATIDLTRSCGYEVVADGIESEAQLQWLRLHGCDQGQGNHLGAPRQAEDFLSG